MAVAERLKTFLEDAGVEYEVLDHDEAYTAQEEAHAAHVPGRNWAKTVVVAADGDPMLAVLPATHMLDLDAFARTVGAKEVELADESRFAGLYPDCEPGAMPPFGHLYDQTTFVDESLRRDEYIAFHAGDHETAVKLAYTVFEELEEPVVARISKEG